MEWLIFIDTNILLDFYRIKSSEIGLPLLDHIDANHNQIITTDQVEMEYKKNRQGAILESLGRFKSPSWATLTPPAFLSDSKATKGIQRSTKEISGQEKRLTKMTERLLRSPAQNDPVYKSLQRLFKSKGQYNLSRDKKIRYEIRDLAHKRFLLGYPPRKDKDTSMGDAINWEWIIRCASDSGKHIVIVSRDSDYGRTYREESFLNDWLSQEFKERVSRKRRLLLTQRLTHALKIAGITVYKQEETQEDALLAPSEDQSLLSPEQAKWREFQTYKVLCKILGEDVTPQELKNWRRQKLAVDNSSLMDS
jgi:hypothetical protein